MALRLGELTAIISADDSRFQRTMGSVKTGLDKVAKFSGFAALAGTATSFAAALAPAIGVVAAAPAAFAAFKAATLSLQLALHGVSDALGEAVAGDMEKFEEKLAALSPTARVVTREVGHALFGLRTTVQDAFFAPLTAESRGLGRLLRGPIQEGMTGISGSLGRMAAQIAAVAREKASLGFLRDLGNWTAGAIDGVAQGIPPLLRGLRDLAGVALEDVDRAGAGLGRLMTRLGHWMSRIAEGGQATRWVRDAVDRLAQLGRIGANLGIVLGAVFAAAGTGAMDVAGGLERITAQMAEWAQSAEGQQQLASTFGLLNQTASDFVAILPLLVGPLGLIVDLLEALPGGTSGAAAQMLAWSLAAGLIASRLGPLAKGLGAAAGGVQKVAGALRDADSPSRRFISRMGGVASAMGRTSAAAARHAATAAVSAGRVVASWTLMAVQAMARAVMMAAAWVVAMGPVGWAIAAAVGAVALIIANWDKVAGFFTTTLPNGIRRGVQWIVGFIGGAARKGFLGPIPWIIANWSRVRDFFTKTLPAGVRSGLNWVVNFTRGIPGRIAGAVGNLGSLLYNAGRNVLIGLYNGMVGMGRWLYDAIMNLVRRIVPGPVLRVLGIASPSKLFAGYGRNVAEGLALGMEGSAGLVSSAAATLAETAAGAGVPITGRAGGGGAAGAAVGAGGTDRTEIVLRLESDDEALVQRIRKQVRVKGRGNVQLAFGTRG